MLVGASIISAAAAAAVIGGQLQNQELIGTSSGTPELRLIETGPSQRQWLEFEEILQLKRDGINFMDITDHADENTKALVAGTVIYPNKVHYNETVSELAQNLSKANLELRLVDFSGFFTRYAKSESGLESSLWLYEQVLALASGRDDVEVHTVDHDWAQKSVVAHIEGTKHPEKVVVVGAHQDSINLLLPSVLPAPGADDDGSGTVTILEVFRVLVESGFKPQNSLEFHWYSAEELGLLGSQDVFAEYAEKGIDVKAMLQQDMTGYSAGSYAANDGQDVVGVITDYVDPALTNFVKLVIDSYCDIPYVETECSYACSDHSSASKYGYPSAFVIESAFGDIDRRIHTTEDKVEYLDFDHMLEHAKLTLGYAVELAGHKF